eukprot:scaffold8611_cov108-Isochrysis_galbana.AAC.10
MDAEKKSAGWLVGGFAHPFWAARGGQRQRKNATTLPSSPSQRLPRRRRMTSEDKDGLGGKLKDAAGSWQKNAYARGRLPPALAPAPSPTGGAKGECRGRQRWEQPTSSYNSSNNELAFSGCGASRQAVVRSAADAVLRPAGNFIASSVGRAASATLSRVCARGRKGPVMIVKEFPRSDDPMTLAVAIPIRVFPAPTPIDGISLSRRATCCRPLRAPPDPRGVALLLCHSTGSRHVPKPSPMHALRHPRGRVQRHVAHFSLAVGRLDRIQQRLHPRSKLIRDSAHGLDVDSRAGALRRADGRARVFGGGRASRLVVSEPAAPPARAGHGLSTGGGRGDCGGGRRDNGGREAVHGGAVSARGVVR